MTKIKGSRCYTFANSGLSSLNSHLDRLPNPVNLDTHEVDRSEGLRSVPFGLPCRRLNLKPRYGLSELIGDENRCRPCRRSLRNPYNTRGGIRIVLQGKEFRNIRLNVSDTGVYLPGCHDRQNGRQSRRAAKSLRVLHLLRFFGTDGWSLA